MSTQSSEERPDANRPLNIAHRGARSLAPENTLSAARKALETGADMWELDTMMTAGRELVVHHDDSLVRTSNVKAVFPDRRPWLVHEFTLEELRRLDFGSWFERTDPFGQIMAGEVTTEDLRSYAGEPVPTLREALLFTRENNWRVNVEIKDLSDTAGDGSVVEKVVDMIADLEMTDRVIVSSFNHRYLERARKRDPKINIGVLLNSRIEDPLPLMQRLQAQAFHPRCTNVTFPQIAALIRNGYGVNVWTVNEPKAMSEFIRAGVSGICTDFPHVLGAVLASKFPMGGGTS